MFERIELPYEYDALEPYIDAETVREHYDKHHKTYTEKFNDLLKKAPDMQDMDALEILTSLDQAPEEIREKLKNNGGGYYNHNLYFESLTPGGAKAPRAFIKQIEEDFGGMETMLDKLHAAATADLFGSGYAWLVGNDGSLDIVVSANQNLPDQDGGLDLLLPVDMWEHAYYLKHKSAKKEFVKYFFRVVNWEKVAERFEMAQ